MKQSWFNNSTYRENYPNGVKIRLDNKKTKLTLRTLHPDYVSFSSSFTVSNKSNEVKVYLDRVGTVRRNAGQLTGGKLMVD